ncbi:MAG: response regulator [Pseudomonadota bacterium]
MEEFLEGYGIRADITFVEALEDGSIRERIQHDLKNPDLDVIVVDYHMDGMDGDELVHLIRESDHVYLPVIFYSSSSVEEILDAVREKKLDGVYIANRQFLIDKFTAVIKSLLMKEQTSKRTRGLLMEGVSEIDVRFNEILDAAWPKLSEGQREQLKVYVGKLIMNRLNGAQKSLENFPTDGTEFEEHIRTKFVSAAYDTYSRWRIASKLLEYLEHDDGERQILKEFAATPNGENEPLNSTRNDYAHKSRSQLDEEHSEEKCISIRRELRRQQANIDGIVGKIV